jgi:mRNA-decapping enzyme subunit 2
MKVDSFEDCLDDLAVRFLLYLPDDEKFSFDRLGFHIEQAFWFYTDMYMDNNPNVCPRLTLRSFAPRLLSREPEILKAFEIKDIPRLMDEFVAYKASVPVCGCILLNPEMSKVLLVRGWSDKAKWGFPKGKIGKDEPPFSCARRECLEECGYDPGPAMNNNMYIDMFLQNRPIRLYVVLNTDEQFKFAPHTRNEIGAIAWHWLKDLPDRKNHNNAKYYFNVMPFVRGLKKIIKKLNTTGSESGTTEPKKRVSIGNLMKAAAFASSASPQDVYQDDIAEEETDIMESKEEEDEEVLEEPEDMLIDVKPVWIGKRDEPESASLLSLFRTGQVQEKPPKENESKALLNLLKQPKTLKRVSVDSCIEQIRNELPSHGLLPEDFDNVLNMLRSICNKK